MPDPKDQIILELRRQITLQNEALHQKNLALDAMWWVWCDGGCRGGVARWSGRPLTQEIVDEAVRNTGRLRAYWANYRHREEMGWNDD